MSKLFSGVAIAFAMLSTNTSPVVANPTINLNSNSGVTVNAVASKSNLVEIEGRSLKDSEAVKVEGQFSRVQIPLGNIQVPRNIQVGICVIGVVSPCNGNVPNNWQIRPRPVSTMPIVRPLPRR